MNIYVGNLTYEVSDSDLEELFGQFGAIVSAKVIKDPQSGKSRGFGFVEFEAQDQAQTAVDELNGSDFKGRRLVVNKAREKEQGGGGGGRGGDRHHYNRSDRGDSRGDRGGDRDDRGDRRPRRRM